MVAFVVPLLLLLAMVVPVVVLMQRRPADAPLSWGEAMVGSVYVAAMMFLAFGVVPHQWIVYADSDLGWRSDRFLVGPGEILDGLPFDIPYTVMRDSIVVGFHVVFAVAMVLLWARWQKRGAKPAAPSSTDSDYGRPLVDHKA